MNLRRSLSATLLLTFVVAACDSEPPPKVPRTEEAPPKQTEPPRKAMQGKLVTYKNGEKVGGETWSDDGSTLKSELTLLGEKTTLTVARAAKKASVEIEGKSMDVEIPDGAIVLENGSWQSLGAAAEAYAKATSPTPVKVVVPAAGAVVDGTIKVRSTDKAGRHVELELDKVALSAEVDADGRVLRVSVPSQDVEVRREGDPAPERKAPPQRPAPDSVAEELVEVTRGPVTIRGTLWTPKAAKGPVPVALVIAGSGPTNRDGNSPVGLKSDSYRLLAEALAAKGIATLRYDKRGTGDSSLSFDVTAMTADDMVGDAAAFLPKLADRGRFSKVTVVGHSEGGLLGLLLAGTTKLDGLVLVATGGRPLRAIIKEQLSSKVDAATMAEVDRLLNDLAAGKPLENVPPGLAPLFNPSSAAYLKSEIDIDPVAKLKALTLPVTVVQGETDVQVSVDDAKRLGAARKGVKVVVLPKVNHLLKTEAARSLPQASYGDPSWPIAPSAVDAIAAGIVR